MTVHVLSIHDASADGSYLAVDLKDVVAALGDEIDKLRFAVFKLDATGPQADTWCDRVQAAGKRGLWITPAEQRELAGGITQTIDAEIAGYPADVDARTLTAADLSLARFPQNKMVCAILAVDSGYFEVLTKDAALADRVAGLFRDVRREDPTPWFS